MISAWRIHWLLPRGGQTNLSKDHLTEMTEGKMFCQKLYPS